jgi:cystathionine beta-lyase/cystathionine gamma-synthase
VAVQSVTKFIGGHSDLLGGVVTVRNVNLLAALRQPRKLAGATPGTLATFLAVRGARTLAVRLERAQRNAVTLAERLARHPNVTLTRYPAWRATQRTKSRDASSRVMARLSHSTCVATPAPPTPCVPDCNSSNTPRAWARSSPPSNGGLVSLAGAPASGAAAAERRYRGRRGSSDRSGSSPAQRAGSAIREAELSSRARCPRNPMNGIRHSRSAGAELTRSNSVIYWCRMADYRAATHELRFAP